MLFFDLWQIWRSQAGAGTAPTVVPPLSAGAKGVAIGDSQLQYGHVANASVIEMKASSAVGWAQMLDPRFDFEIWTDPTNLASESPDRVTTYSHTTRVATGQYSDATASYGYAGANLGMAGDTLQGMALRQNGVINQSPDFALIMGGTNTGDATDTPAASGIATLAAMIAAFQDNNIEVCVRTILPRHVVGALPAASIEISTSAMTRITTINDWIRNNAVSLGYRIWDPWEAMRDPAYGVGHALYGTDLAGMVRDGVHQTVLGAYTDALYLKACLATLINPGVAWDTNPTTLNLFTGDRGRFFGTGGTANAGMSGVMPSNWFWSVTGNAGFVTGVTSVIANAETGGQSIQAVITSNGLGAANAFDSLPLSATNLVQGSTWATGDYIQCYWEVEIVATHTNLVAWQAWLGQTSTLSAKGLAQTNAAYNSDPYPQFTGRFWLKTAPLKIGAQTGLNPRLDFRIRRDVSGSCTIKIHRAIVRNVPNPAIRFPFDWATVPTPPPGAPGASGLLLTMPRG